MHEPPIALEAYGRLADAYAARIDAKAHNALYDRPAVLSLLPPVEGRRVLDAGCGPGVYAEWLAGRGAEVVGIDVCPRMVELARLRLGGRAHVVEADLARPLDFLPPASFDLVVSAYRRSLQAMLGPLLGAGFVLEQLLEPRPVPEFRDQEPADYEKLTRQPGFICFRARKPAAAE